MFFSAYLLSFQFELVFLCLVLSTSVVLSLFSSSLFCSHLLSLSSLLTLSSPPLASPPLPYSFLLLFFLFYLVISLLCYSLLSCLLCLYHSSSYSLSLLISSLLSLLPLSVLWCPSLVFFPSRFIPSFLLSPSKSRQHCLTASVLIQIYHPRVPQISHSLVSSTFFRHCDLGKYFASD